MTDHIPAEFTPIAYRKRRSPNADVKLMWQPLLGAPLTMDAARILRDEGLLVMASEHKEDVVVLLVKKAAPYSPRVLRRWG